MRLAAVAPFSLHYTVRILQRLPSNRIDLWDGRTYRRLVFIGRSLGLISVTQAGSAAKPTVNVDGAAELKPTVERLLGLRVDLNDFYRLTSKRRLLRAVAVSLRGMKPPRYPTLFEALVNAICCQQLSLHVGILMMGRVAELAGHSRKVEGTTYWAFPPPDTVAGLRHDHLKKLGLGGAKASSILGVAEKLAAGELTEAELETRDTPAALERLQQLPGIGPWSARYALLRGMGRLEVFPSGDSGAAKSLGHLLGRGTLSFDEVDSLSTHWKDYAGLLYFHLLGNRYVSES